MTSGVYIARIVEDADHGIRLEPTEDSSRPERPSDINLLGLAIALALGAAGYHHHPEPRDPELQTLDALLAGNAVMPWRADRDRDASEQGSQPYIVCEPSLTGMPRCQVQYRAS